MSNKDKKSTFSLENFLDKNKQLHIVDAMTKEELFKEGFGAYIYPDGIFLKLKIKTYVKTTCPINGSEDIIEVVIKYRVSRFGALIEHHSFLAWLDTFEEQGLGLEATVDTIYTMIDKVVSPTILKVVAQSHSNYRSNNFAKREKKI